MSYDEEKAALLRENSALKKTLSATQFILGQMLANMHPDNRELVQPRAAESAISDEELAKALFVEDQCLNGACLTAEALNLWIPLEWDKRSRWIATARKARALLSRSARPVTGQALYEALQATNVLPGFEPWDELMISKRRRFDQSAARLNAGATEARRLTAEDVMWAGVECGPDNGSLPWANRFAGALNKRLHPGTGEREAT